MSISRKIIYLPLGILFLVLGLVGLIIPIVPGILFLLGAVYLLSRGSGRIGNMVRKHPDLKRLDSKMTRMKNLSGFERLQLVTLMAINAIAGALHKVWLGMRRLILRFSAR